MNSLTGIRVIDLSVNAPGPFASLLLADLGAEVISIINPAVAGSPVYTGATTEPMLGARGGPNDALQRGKTTQALDLKSAQGRTGLLALIDNADILLSEMRPGKLEALGLGYDTLASRNPRLILCEISGYGKNHPQSQRAGHDINYLARSGVLSLIQDQQGRPVIPQNILADYAAGGSLSVNAILAALYEREKTGQGRQIAVSMTAGLHYLISDLAAITTLAGYPSEQWRTTLSGGIPTYSVYQTADKLWLAVGALEPKFIAQLADALAWPALIELMQNHATWEHARQGLADRFQQRSRAEWSALFDPLDACVSPVLTVDELSSSGLTDLDTVFGNREKYCD